MTNSVLYRHISQHFSDDAIGNVTLRRHCSSRSLHPEQVMWEGSQATTTESISSQESQSTEPSKSSRSDNTPWYATFDDKTDGVNTKPESQKSPGTTKAGLQLKHGTHSASVTATINRGIEHYRRRRREIQQQYRKRLKDRATSLEANSVQLQAEIQNLTVQHQLLLAGVPTKVTPWSVVVEYWNLFQNGLRQPKSLPGILSTSSDLNRMHKTFLHAVMGPNVSVNAGFGVDALLEDWRLLSLNLEDLDIRLIGLEYGEGDCLVARARGTTTITETMLLNEFPHLMHGAERRRWSSIALRLLGRQLVVCTTTRFVWDATVSRIVSAHYTVDLATALLKLLGNVEDVAYMLSIPFSAQGIRRWPGQIYSKN